NGRDGDVEALGHLFSHGGSALRVSVPYKCTFDRTHETERGELHSRLLSGSAYRHAGRVFVREVFGGDSCGGTSPKRGNVGRVHDRERPARLGVREVDDTLNAGESVQNRVLKESPIHLDAEIGISDLREPACLGVELTAGGINVHDLGSKRLPLGVRAKCDFDSLDV